MKENPKQLTRSEIRKFSKSRAEATNVTEKQLRHQMEGEFAARQRVVDFLAGTKSGDSRFEYFKRFHGGTNTTKGNIAFMALPENGEFLKIHKEFEDIRIDYWWALSERSLSLKYTDKLLAQGLKKILDQKTAEISSENQQSQTPQAK